MTLQEALEWTKANPTRTVYLATCEIYYRIPCYGGRNHWLVVDLDTDLSVSIPDDTGWTH